MNFSDLRMLVTEEFDPADMRQCEKLAFASLGMCALMARVLLDDEHGLHLGRDQRNDIAAKIFEIGKTLGLLNGANGMELIAFREALVQGEN